MTDADVALSYIPPESYFGGRMPLNRNKALAAIESHVARPLGLSVDEAAAMIRNIVEENMASAIKREVHLRGYHPEDFVLLAFGGGGPTHVAGYRADVPVAVIFPQAPVFCALGSSVMDIMHVYEVSRRMVFMEAITEKFTTEYEGFNKAVRGLVEQAKIDLGAEGLDVDSAIFQIELDMLYGGQVHVKRVSSPRLYIESEADMAGVYNAFEKEFSEAFSPHVVYKPGGVYLENIVLKATIPTEKLELAEHPLGPPDPSSARSGERDAYWPELKARCATQVYRFEAMQPGHQLVGPVLVDADFITLVIPPRQRFHIDGRGLGILEYVESTGTAL